MSAGSFFGDEDLAPPAPEPPRRPPPWSGPPDNVIGRALGWSVVLARTDRLAVVLDRFRAYPTGVSFTLTALRHHDDEPLTEIEPLGFAPRPGAFQLGVALADGRRVLAGHGGRPEEGAPVLAPQGGGGGGHRSDWDMWLHPLPPPGPVLVVVRWPEVGLEEQATELDGAELVAAADEAIELWPDERPTWGRSGPRPHEGRMQTVVVEHAEEEEGRPG